MPWQWWQSRPGGASSTSSEEANAPLANWLKPSPSASRACSKHLRVLKDGGFVSSRTDAQHRRYRLEPLHLEAIDHWLAPYRILWTRHLDVLERHLEEQETK